MKRCFKCGIEKDLSYFYTHPRMADGHLGKCKECTRRDVAIRTERLKSDPEWVEGEMERHRQKQRRYRSEGKVCALSASDRYQKTRNYRERNPEKHAAHSAVNREIRAGRFTPLPCEVCGSKANAHHDDYSKQLEVVWLCPKHHAERHVELRKIERAKKRAIQPF